MTTPNSVGNLFLQRALRFGALLALALIVFYVIAQAGHASHENSEDHATVPELNAQVEKNPQDEEATFKLARHMVRDGDSRGAFGLMQRLVKQQPKSESYWDGYARCAAANNDMVEAVHAYRRILELNPQNAAAHAYLGQIDIKAGMPTVGLEEIGAARKIDPKVGLNVFVWTQALFEKNRSQEAYDAIVTSINVDPTQDGLYPLLGRLGLQIGREKETEKLLWRRIEVSPMYPVGEPRCALIRLILAKSHDADTLSVAEILARDAVTGKTPDFNAALAEVLLAKHDMSGARKALLQGLTYGNNNESCVRLLVKIAQQEGKTAEAAQWRAKLSVEQNESAQVVALRQAAAAAPQDAAKRLALAQELEKQTEYGPAAEACEVILQQNPNDAAAIALRARCREEAIHKLAQSPEVLEGKN